MSIVKPNPGNTDAVSVAAQRPPEHYVSRSRWGWGSFVNFYLDGAGMNDVQNVENVFSVNGLGEDRNEYPTGAPSDDAESWVLGRRLATQVTIDCWASVPDTSGLGSGQLGLRNLFRTGNRANFVVGLGEPQYDAMGNLLPPDDIYAFTATVKNWQKMAGLDNAVGFRVTLRPSGKIVEL